MGAGASTQSEDASNSRQDKLQAKEVDAKRTAPSSSSSRAKSNNLLLSTVSPSTYYTPLSPLDEDTADGASRPQQQVADMGGQKGGMDDDIDSKALRRMALGNE